MEIILSYLNQGFSAIVPFVVLLGLLIFVHELGHFLVAKFFGVRVETFSLGFGKKILQFKKGDTTYALSIIPLGGYVKMFGDEMGMDISDEEKKYSFLHKPVGQRIAVVLAGPIMNLLFAIFLFMIVMFLGENTKAPILGDLASTSEAYRQGFRSGDKVLNVDEKEISTWGDFQKVLSKSVGKKLVVSVQREETGTIERLEASPALIPNDSPLSLDKEIGSIDGLNTISRAPALGILNPKSLAAVAGFKTGDIVEEINGKELKQWRQFERQLRSLTGPVQLKILRSDVDGKEAVHLNLKLDLPVDRISNLETIGIEPSDLYLHSVVKDTPAMKAGFLTGDRIVKVDGLVLTKWDELLNSVKSFKEEKKFIEFEILRNGEAKTFQVAPQITHAMNNQGLQENRYTIGIVPLLAQIPGELVILKVTEPWPALLRSIEKTYDVSAMTVISFIKLFTAEISARNISGVISIGQAASETFKIGLSQFISMMGLISVNLFILNLLPIPVLDGGHMVFYTIELLKGSPLSLKKMELAQRAGFAVLMSLMVFALFNDISRIFSN